MYKHINIKICIVLVILVLLSCSTVLATDATYVWSEQSETLETSANVTANTVETDAEPTRKFS